MAEAIIGPLVGRLHELAVGEARALVAVNDDMQRLRDKLMWLQAFLREAEAKRRAVPDEITKVWLHQTRDAVFDAEDALDHFYLNVDMSRDDLQHPNLSMHEKEQKQLERLLATLTEQERRNGDHQPVVISVYGKSGTGKTTLVRKVYKEMVKKNHFDIQAMESFGPYLTGQNILHQIVQQLTPDNVNCPRSKVNDMLRERLGNKRYLLVIDGEVTSTEWKNILIVLADVAVGAKGNRIVHIRHEKPEEPTSSRHVPIQLKNLEEDTTIQLFRRRLQIEKDLLNDDQVKILVKMKRLLRMELEYQKVKKYQKEIFTITDGLPLAVVLLSGLVQTKEFPHEWTEVFRYLRSKKTKRLECIMALCFDDLPHELKSCFLYFAALPINVTIEADTLVCMWMAEGFLRPMVGMTLEKVGYIYLNELIARNLVNLVIKDDDSNPGSMFVSIQNTVHEFLQNEAHEESFLEVHRGDDIPTLSSARRLSLQNYTDKYAALANPLPKLRSIFSQFEQEPKEESENIPRRRMRAIFKKKKEPKEEHEMLMLMKRPWAISDKKEDIRSHIEELLYGSEFLRVINLQGIEIGEKLPRAISKVVRVQYLGITSCSLKKIPRCIGRLTSLQTLDVRETSVRELPQAFWMIKTLRHVFCFALKLPKQMVSLKHLQTLNSIQLDDREQGLHATLGKMILLENLFVWNITYGNMESLSNALSMLEYLRTLALHGQNIPSRVFTITSLRRVKFMVLQGELQWSPELYGMDSFLPNLVMLSLERTKVSQWFIAKLSELPSLSTLALYAGSYMEEHLSFPSTGFLRLKKIKLDVHMLKTIKVQEGGLPKLQELDILSENCQPKIDAERRIVNTIV